MQLRQNNNTSYQNGLTAPLKLSCVDDCDKDLGASWPEQLWRDRAMKRKEALGELREIQEIANIEVAHRLADDVLCRLLHSLGYTDVVAEYNKVVRWYSSQ